MVKVIIEVIFIINSFFSVTFVKGYKVSFFSLYHPDYTTIFYRLILPLALEKQKYYSTIYLINSRFNSNPVLADNILIPTDKNKRGSRRHFPYSNLFKGFKQKREFNNNQDTNDLLNKTESRKSTKSQPKDMSYMSSLYNLQSENKTTSKIIIPINEISLLTQELANKSSNLKIASGTQKTLLGSQGSSLTEEVKKAMDTTKTTLKIPVPIIPKVKQPDINTFYKALDKLERKFYLITCEKLLLISPADRKENGISFVQSALFLQMILMSFSTEVGKESRKEIYDNLELQISYEDTIQMINNVVTRLPKLNKDLKFYWSSRLALSPGHEISRQFQNEIAPLLRLSITWLNTTQTPEQIARALNHMVETDSRGAIHDTFAEDEISDGIQAIILTTLYMRGRWRSAPTLLNGTRLFRDAKNTPKRFVRCIRINDIMRYTDLTEWDAEAVELPYATPGLSLLLLIPRDGSLRRIAELVTRTSISEVTQRMQTLRIGTTLPLYTLRMTLLLPNKLEAMGISKLMGVNVTNDSFALSHAVQRIMFWAEAGRNAFKDDGMEWDEVPQLELVVDRPYVFFVRWNNLTIMNGNFAL